MSKMFFPVTAILFCCMYAFVCFDVEILNTLFFDRPIINSLHWTGAPLDVAVQVVNERNHDGINLTAIQIEKLRDENCVQVGMDTLVYSAEYYYKHYRPGKCLAFLGSACNDATGMAKIAREMDTLFLVDTFPTPELPNYQLYNTTFLFGPNYDTLAVATKALLLHYKWYHVTFILDSTAFTPLYVYESLRIKKLCDLDPSFDFEIIRIDANIAEAANNALTAASRRSRVIFLMAQVSLTLRMLKQASDLGMAHGEYIFITVQGNPVQPYGIVAMLDYPDASMWNITRAVIYITLSQVNREGDDVNKRVEMLAQSKYNSSYPVESPMSKNYVVQGTMDAVEVFAAAVIAARRDKHNDDDLCSASTLAPYIRNKTFNLSRGTIHVTYDHKKRIDTMYFAFDAPTGRMKHFGMYYDFEDRMELLSTTFPTWISGSPPPDLPPCGFLGNRGRCAPIPTYLRIEIAVPVCIILAAAVVAAIWKWQANSVLGAMLRKRWLVTPDELSLCLPTTTQGGAGPGTWRGVTVWLTYVVRPDKVDVKACSRYLLLRQHANLVSYYGFCLYPGYLVLVSEYCPRGSLPLLLQQTHVEVDFKLSFFVDLVQGLWFLHSAAGPHGHLTMRCCLIDGHFTLKIARFGLVELETHLGIIHHHEQFSRGKAPEFLNHNHQKTIPGDVFSLGLILGTLCTESHAPTSGRPAAEVPLQDPWPAEFRSLIQQCLSADPQTRPALRQIWKALKRIFPEKNLGSTAVAERILARFTLHTATLEDAVLERTAAVQQEQAKCDALLRELLPPFVVDKLRNRQQVEAAIYGSVTIYFSKLEGFISWTANAPPAEVLHTLSILNLSFDKNITDYDVRKVESVGDCYMVVGGIPKCSAAEHSRAICAMALGLQKHFATSPYSNSFKLRCGIHSGTCATGVIGSKVPRFCLFGDAVNVASRIETSGTGGRIHLSQETALLVEHAPPFCVQERGFVELKGKGLVRTYWLEDAQDYLRLQDVRMHVVDETPPV